MSALVGGIEAGGTKFVLRRGHGPGRHSRAESRIATTTPDETIGQAIEFFQAQIAKLGPLAAIGIASFGPIDPRAALAHIWLHHVDTQAAAGATPILPGPCEQALGMPVGFDTDVNVAALGEWRWGAGQGIDNLIYLTIGTGIGGGGLVNGKLMHGLVHPEMGHIRIPHDLDADPYPGHCPYHGDCLEGLACGPAINERWKQPSENLPQRPSGLGARGPLSGSGVGEFYLHAFARADHPGRRRDVAARNSFALIRGKMSSNCSTNTCNRPRFFNDIDAYIVSPGLGDRSGVLGAFALAQQLVGMRASAGIRA